MIPHKVITPEEGKEIQELCVGIGNLFQERKVKWDIGMSALLNYMIAILVRDEGISPSQAVDEIREGLDHLLLREP